MLKVCSATAAIPVLAALLWLFCKPKTSEELRIDAAPAVATAKLLLAIDPSKVEVLEWVDSQAARRFERQSRNAFQLTY